jgi:hypothetical protein
MSFKLVDWSPTLDLSNFYSEASRRGFVNNASQKAMIDCFKNEKTWAVWILYQNNEAVGSVAAHSFDDVMGPNSFRVLSRVCAFAETAPRTGLLTLNRMVREHQHISDQYFLPKCIEWAGKENIYATSNQSKEASQRLVHTIYFPTLEKVGIVEHVKEVYYRGHWQTVWRINAEKFLENLGKFPKWS